ncbi:hypothetical protein [Paraburkholderia sp.]|uniref:hypothetical protein n=1 Tax=Paraburkholderia sp. TaxID=1926495 RepID=UPI002382047C|nr:hypothetical protein [Paraburkholderia sp.]MDE1181380.1 hypothetical protein [Paraburkholderia sp.]
MRTTRITTRIGGAWLACALGAAVLGGCALPQSKVESGGTRPTLALIGAPSDASLMLDGTVIGQASSYDGVQHVLTVEEGAHTVEVRRNEQIVLRKKVFATSGETIKVDVANGGTQ